MIVPMKRLMLFCSSASKASALTALRELGSVHVVAEVRESEGIRKVASELTALERALRVLEVATKGGTFAFKPEGTPESDIRVVLEKAKHCSAPDSAEDVNRLAEWVTSLREESFAVELQFKRYAPFGEMDPALVSDLAQAGIPVVLFKAPKALWEELDAPYIVRFREDNGFIFGAWLSGDPLPAGCEVMPHPEMSTEQMRIFIREARQVADTLVQLLAESAPKLKPQILAQCKVAESERVVAGVLANMRDCGEVVCLKGYIPERASEELMARAQKEGWGVVLETPETDDPEVPVLLEPPRGFRAISVLFKGLGILPGYTEGDCSVPFYLFFSLFFAMLVGDAGYGAVMLAGILIAAWKLRKNPAARPALLIFTVFALATITWGVLSGTYFGITKSALPEVLRQIPTVSWLSDDNNVMFLCFLIGAVHISVARLWNATLLAPHLKAVGEIGWLGVTWSMFLIVCGIVVSWFTRPEWTWWLLGGSVALILVPLVADIRHEGVGIGMLPLNVISAMGDIISYVRLFAVGLASVKVAENFNSMALSLDLPIVLRILATCAILLVGHGLNLAMGALSVLVHAVRLNTLEFSNAKGITWSGQPYLPFKQPQP